MRAGTLKERITLEKQTPAGGSDEWAEATAWVGDGNVWASVTANTSDEKSATDGVQTINGFTVRIRHRDGITSAHRIQWRGRTLDITGVTPDERRRELVINAVENPQRA